MVGPYKISLFPTSYGVPFFVNLVVVPTCLPLSFANASLSFSVTDSSYSGNNGCNMISGNFSISKDKVNFGEGLSTRMFCQGIDEQKFHNVLNLTNRMQIKNDVLFLFENENKLAEFIREQ